MPTLTQKGDGWSYTANAQQFISGGMFVKAMSVAVVNASLTNLDVDQCDATADREVCVGIAANNAASGELVTVLTEGFFISPVGRATEAGQVVGPIGVAGAEDALTNAGVAAGSSIGKALSTAGSAANVLYKLTL